MNSGSTGACQDITPVLLPYSLPFNASKMAAVEAYPKGREQKFPYLEQASGTILPHKDAAHALLVQLYQWGSSDRNGLLLLYLRH